MERCNTSLNEFNTLFLHNLCFLIQERFHFLKIRIMMAVFFSCFTHMEWHIAPSPSENIRVCYFTILLLYYCMLFNEVVHRLVKEVLHVLAPTRSFRNTIINNHLTQVVQWSILKLCCPSSIDPCTYYKVLDSCLCENDFDTFQMLHSLM